MRFPKAKQGYTLLEALIVMGVIASMMGLGIIALSRFHNYSILQSNYNDLASNLKVLQNMARNSVMSQKRYQESGSAIGSVPDAYMILFESNKYSPYSCDVSGTNSYVCDLDQSTINAQLDRKVSLTSNCLGIAFKRGDADILVINNINGSTYTKSTQGSCELSLSHQSLGSQKKISINVTSNFFNIE